MHFDAIFNRQKTREVTISFETRILRFNLETKLTKTVQNYPKIHGQTKGVGRSHNRPPPLKTPLVISNSLIIVDKMSYNGVYIYLPADDSVSLFQNARS